MNAIIKYLRLCSIGITMMTTTTWFYRRLATSVFIILAGCSSPEKQTASITTSSVAQLLNRKPAPPTASVVAGQEALSRARGLLGTPYLMGGSSPAGMDCSGLIWYVFRQLGIQVPRTSRQQAVASLDVPFEEAQPGDIFFFAMDANRGVSHAGIYDGDGSFIHAPKSGKTVSYARYNDYWQAKLVKIGRLQGK